MYSYLLIGFVLTIPAIIYSDYYTGIVLGLSFLFFAVGGIIYNIIFKVNVKRLLRVSHTADFSLDGKSILALRATAYILGFASIAISIAYFAQVGISLFADQVGTARLDNRNAANGSFLYQRVFRVLFPTVILYLYVLWRTGPKKITFRFIRVSSVYFVIFLFLNIAFLAFTGMKANVVMFLIFPILIFHSLYIAKISNLNSIIALILVFCSIFFMIHRMMPTEEITGIFNFLLFRIGSGATDGLHYVIHIYEPKVGLQFGYTILNDFLSLFGKLGIPGLPKESLGQQIAMDLLGARYNGEQAAVTLSGELYLNFGVVGLTILSIILGCFLQHFYVRALKSKSSVLRAIFFAYAQSAILMILGGPVFSMALDYFIFLALFFFLWRFTHTIILLSAKAKSHE